MLFTKNKPPHRSHKDGVAIRDEVLTANARIGVAYEMLYAPVARSGSQRHIISLNNAGVHLLRASLRVAC